MQRACTGVSAVGGGVVRGTGYGERGDRDVKYAYQYSSTVLYSTCVNGQASSVTALQNKEKLNSCGKAKGVEFYAGHSLKRLLPPGSPRDEKGP